MDKTFQSTYRNTEGTLEISQNKLMFYEIVAKVKVWI